MKTIIRNILAILVGVIVGGAVNMGLIMLSGSVIPPPEGVDPTDTESLRNSMHLFEARHFIFPFLAHALGTLVGAWLAALIAATHKIKFALGIGIVFLAGGIASVYMLPSPLWFSIVDIALAYIPMAWIGGKLAERIAWPSHTLR